MRKKGVKRGGWVSCGILPSTDALTFICSGPEVGCAGTPPFQPFERLIPVGRPPCN